MVRCFPAVFWVFFMFPLGCFPSLCLKVPPPSLTSGMQPIPFSGVFIMGIVALISRSFVFCLLQSLPLRSNPVIMQASPLCFNSGVYVRAKSSLWVWPFCLLLVRSSFIVILPFPAVFCIPDLCFQTQLSSMGTVWSFGFCLSDFLGETREVFDPRLGPVLVWGELKHLGYSESRG